MSIRNKYFPVVALVILNIFFGLFIFQDFGESWDEDSVHTYADMSFNAYKYFFTPDNLRNYYGDDILRFYGPVFPVFVKSVISPLKLVDKREIISVWHLYNFLCFQLGLFFFYNICIRYCSKPAAFVSTLLFNSQPLLWGHAFVNPRDIPFMVFFMGAISCGLSFSDTLAPSTDGQVSINTIEDRGDLSWRNLLRSDLSAGLQYKRGVIYFLTGCIALITVMLVSRLADPIVANAVHKLYSAQDDNIFSRYFFQIAQNARNIPLESYINKGIATINSLAIVFLLILIPLLLLVCCNFFRNTFHQWMEMYGKNKWQIFRQSIDHGWQKVLSGARKVRAHPPIEISSLVGELQRNLLFLKTWQFWSAALLLGLCISTRVAGPLAGLLVALAILRKSREKWIWIVPVYFVISFLVVYLTWPFLWGDVINRFLESISVMSNFLWDERILFNGEYLKGYALPLSYFPSLLCIQLTETGVILFFTGLFIAVYRYIKNSVSRVEGLVLLGWFFIPFAGILLFRTPMYDNTRHFLFIIPPLFIIAGFSLQAIYEKINWRVFTGLACVVLLPGLFNIITLHPYSYVYYNSFVGGLSGAYNRYEMDYYGTSLKETTEHLNAIAEKNARVLVTGPIHLVMSYARQDLNLTSSPAPDSIANYDYVVYLNRFKYPTYLADFPEIFQAGRGGAVFSGIRALDHTQAP